MNKQEIKAPQDGAAPESAETASLRITGEGSLSTPNLSRKFPRPTDESILVCPVGGVGRIGMNWTLYGHAGKWLLVDAGSMFAPKGVQGVDAIMPDPECLKQVLPNLVGLVVTHAHEDHIGGIHRMWPRISCPIYASPFAAEVLRGRFKEMGTLNKVQIRTFLPGETISLSPFDIQTIPITHSAPECVAMGIRTPVGTVLHTGDWKIDSDPLVGSLTDFEALRKLGDEGVLAMTCDSTNAEREAGPTSESQVARSLEAVFRSRRGMIVVSCFASNVSRLAAIEKAAAASGRKVALAGYSLIRNYEAAQAVGLIEDSNIVLTDLRHIRGLDRHEIVLVCTGTQGEERSALSKLARGTDYRLPQVKPGDTVIHSARVIPGNKEEVEAVIGALRELGAEVLMGSDGDNPLHVTGHAAREELRMMYGLVRPRFAVPVHGEPSHMAAHAVLAKECGVQDAAITIEGDVLRVSRRKVERIAHVDVSHLAAASGERVSRLVKWDEKEKRVVLTSPETYAPQQNRPSRRQRRRHPFQRRAA